MDRAKRIITKYLKNLLQQPVSSKGDFQVVDKFRTWEPFSMLSVIPCISFPVEVMYIPCAVVAGFC